MSESLVPFTMAFSYITRDEVLSLVSKIFNFENPKAINFRIEPFSTEKLGHLGVHMLLTVQVHREVNSRNSTINYTFFPKSVEPNCSDFNAFVFQEESKFYIDVLPLLRQFRVEPWAPQCYLVKNNVFVLENLKSQEYHSTTKKFTVRQLKTAIDAVARFHASSMLLEHQLKKPLNVAFPGFFEEKVFSNDNEINLRWLSAGIEVAESVACDLGLDPIYVSMAYEAVLQRNNLTDNKWSVLCHRDLWTNNLMFGKDDKCCRLLDFQMIAYASFAIDITQLIYLNLDKAMRQKLEQFSIEVYHSVLEKTLTDHGMKKDKVIPLKKVSEAFEEKRIYGLVALVQLGPVRDINKQAAEDYAKDPIRYKSYNFVSRKDFVKKIMQSDEDYRFRVQESVKELIDYMKRTGKTH